MKNNLNPLIIILLGPPGSGKGTHAYELSKKYNIPQISTGELFRDNMQNNTLLGQKVQSYMNEGKLVPDEIVLDMLQKRVKEKDCLNGYILDGFPRTIYQAKKYNDTIKSHVNLFIFNLVVSDKLIIDRLSGRLTCKNCGKIYHKITMPPKEDDLCDSCKIPLIHRNDDKQEVIIKRLSVYYKQTEPLINYYKDHFRKNYINIDASQSKEEILTNIMKKIT